MSLQGLPKKVKIINLLTICRRAGKIVMGFDPVKDSVFSGEACCICTTGDLSPKTLKEAAFIGNREGVPLFKLNLTMDDVWASLGKKAGVLSVCDEGFMKRLEDILKEADPTAEESLEL